MAIFEAAIPTILAHEGGYVNDPDDPGGETNYGISRRAHPDVDIAALSRDAAAEIYRRDYWQPNGYGRIDDQALATKVFDFAVNMGPSRSHRLLQQAVNLLGPVCRVCGAGRGRSACACPHADRLRVDGVLGPLSFAAVNEADARRLVRALENEAARRYHAIASGPRGKFLKGWLNRCYS